MTERKYSFVEVTLDPEDYDKIKEVYRLHKEQATRLFGLSSGVRTDEDIMDIVKDAVENNITLLAYDNEGQRYCAVIIFENIMMYDGIVANMQVHIVISKKYWGRASRDIINDAYRYVGENMKPIKRLEAFVPANNYGVIKLLKDVGFKCEGTLRDKCIYKNKAGEPTFYNELVYGNINVGAVDE